MILPAACVLPCAPSRRYIDRFSILEDQYEDGNGLVLFWPILKKLLSQNIASWSSLLDLLENISITIRSSSTTAGDYGTLRCAIEDDPDFFTDVWPAVVRFALALPEHFETGVIPKLEPGQMLALTRSECASLVAHQFLCSIDSPRADFYDFSIWYGSNQRHPVAVAAYLKSLFAYFRLRGKQPLAETGTETVQFMLSSADTNRDTTANTEMSVQPWQETRLSSISIEYLPAHSTKFQEIDHQGIDGAVVISANKDIGFGESATQEELHVGATPEACVAVLFTVRLEPDQALSINGAQPIIRFTGQRRDISWEFCKPLAVGGRMLFMDALELDLVEANAPDTGASDELHGNILPDLSQDNINRELRKAYAAFSSWPLTSGSTVWTGLWGCGAFNGEPTVKLLILWAAASLAERRLRIILDHADASYGHKFEQLVQRLPKSWNVLEIILLLQEVPKCTERFTVLKWLNDYDGF